MQLLESKVGAQKSTGYDPTAGVGSPTWTSSGQWDTASLPNTKLADRSTNSASHSKSGQSYLTLEWSVRHSHHN